MNSRPHSENTADKNIDSKVVEGFGDEWARFDQSSIEGAEISEILDDYFHIFPWDQLPDTAIGMDVGCGSGRWAKLVINRVSKLFLLDASSLALDVARKKLSGHDNAVFVEASVGSIPLPPASLDFAYSLGVLHHVPDTRAAISEISRVLKPGAPFLVYLYYSLDGRGFLFRLIWKISDLCRRVISVLPFRIKRAICDVIAGLVYWPFAKFAGLAEKLNSNAEKLPLFYYRNKSFYSMRTDALDRFGTRLEQRFSRKEIRQMLEENGFQDIVFSDRQPFWCAIGIRKY